MMIDMQNHIWVVEIKEGDEWRPLHWLFDTRYEARADCASFKQAGPKHKLRIRKYIRWAGK